jgi:tape measure domain-containing protein
VSTEYSVALRLTANTAVIDELDRKLNAVQRSISTIQGMNLGTFVDRQAQQAVEAQISGRQELINAIRSSNAELVAESSLLRLNARLARNYSRGQGQNQSGSSRNSDGGLSATVERGRQLAEVLERAGQAQERAFGGSVRTEVQQYTAQLQQARGQLQGLISGLQEVTGATGRTNNAPLDTVELQRQVRSLEDQVQQLTRIQQTTRDATDLQRQQSQQTQDQAAIWQRLGAATDAVLDRQIQGERSLLALRQQSLDLVTGIAQKARAASSTAINLATGTDLGSRGKRGLIAGGLTLGAAAYSGVGDALQGITGSLTTFTGVGSKAANQMGQKLVDAASGMGDAINSSLHGAPELLANIGHMVAQHPGLWGAAAVALAAFGDKIPGVIRDTADLTVKINEATGATDKLAGAAKAVAQATKDMAQGNLNMPFSMSDGVARDLMDRARGPVVQALPAFQERGLQQLDASSTGNYLDTLNAYRDGLATKRTELNVTKAINDEQTRGVRFQEALNRESKRQRSLGIDGGFDSNALLPQGLSGAGAQALNGLRDAAAATAAAAAKTQQELADAAAEAARLEAALKPTAEIQWNWAQALRQGKAWQADIVALQQKETAAIRESVAQRQLELRALETEQKIQAALARNEAAQQRRQGVRAGVGAGLAMANIPGQQIFQAAMIGGAVGGPWGAVAGAATGAAVAVGQFGVESAKVAVNVVTLEKRLEFLSAGFDSYDQVLSQAAASGAKFGQTQAESLEAFSKTYGRLRPMGMSLAQITTIYEGFNTAAQLSGSSAAESAGAYTQLIQAMGAGALRGEELNSVLEQAPMVSQAIAKEMGTTVGMLKKFAEQGLITGDVVMRALQKVRDEGSDKLAAALETPAAKLKRFEVAWEKLQIALTEHLIPAISDSVVQLAAIIDSLGPHIEAIAKDAAGALGIVVDLINMATKPGATAARAAIEGGRLPMGLWDGSGASELFKGTSGAGGVGLSGIRKEAEELAKLRQKGGIRGSGPTPADIQAALLEVMQNRLKKMDAATKGAVKQVDDTVWDGKGPGPKEKKSGKSELEKELERQEKLAQTIYKDQLQLDEQLQRNQLELDDGVFRHRMDLERQLFDYKLQLQQQERDNWVNGLTGAGRQAAAAFAKYASDRQQDDSKRLAMVQEIAAAERKVAMARAMVVFAQRNAAAEAAGFAPGSAGVAGGGAVAQLMAAAERNLGLFAGQTERCADAMRKLFEQTGIGIGVSKKAWDGLASGARLASSFFGSDIGQRINRKEDLRPGDLVGFEQTYGNFGKGVQTHVGMYAGGGMMYDHSSQKGLVKRPVDTFAGKFMYGVRPYALGGASEGAGSGVAQGGMDGYLKRLSYLETRLRNIPNAEGSGAQGYFQAMAPFTKEAVKASGGLNPRSSDYGEASKAVAAWIAKHRPEAHAAIQSGNYDRADAVLRPTWPSLPGGSQAQPDDVQARARQFLGAPGSDISPLAGQAGVASAQGGVQQASAELQNMQEKWAAFQAMLNAGADDKVQALTLELTEGFRTQTAEVGKQTEALQLRNRLQMEGVAPEVIAGEMSKLEVSQKLAEKLQAADEALKNKTITDKEHASTTTAVKKAAEEAAVAIDKMTAASVAAADPVAQLIQEWNTKLKDTRGMIASLAGTVESELGSAMSNAISGVISGTTTVQQAFSQMFANIGQSFIQMATQMIAKALIMKALGILGGSSGGLFSGGASVTGGGFGDFSGGSFGVGSSSLDLGGLGGSGALAGAYEGIKFAEGGFVTGTTNAVIGEGGENEYVIPESKMSAAMQRYSAGSRGSAVIPGSGESGSAGETGGVSTIDVSYRVTEVNSVRYVDEATFQAGMRQAAEQGAAAGHRRVFGDLRNSRSQRARVGMR